ncbi:MAG: DNA primase [Candidatus Omnitrophica bacterium]|nr:DNA primase [Candidatus Omnitrophota bacterium]MBU4590902.1 DNA primase [Candidatus Omnitrophota bacterium]
MGKIPEHILNEIQDRCDIVEVISSYIPLKPAGRNFKTNCPFHHEKTPSFIVSPDKQIYHCFGCNSGGNVFNFIKEYEKMDFIEAVKMLAKKTGVKLPEYKRENTDSDSIIGIIHSINDIAANYYSNTLEKSGDSSSARRYIEKRGLEKDIVKKFRIGYADSSWRSLSEYLSKRGINIDAVLKAGLIQKGKDASHYDLFRDRLIFPICDVRGRVLGFGARVLDDSLPKYINSPETMVYKKGHHLYSLNFAKTFIREKGFAIITEGYLDVISCHQYGITNAISSLGTALTQEQIRALKRYTHNVVMVYDADQAGQMATLRGLEMLLEEGMNVKVATLDKGHDPDSYIRKFGPRCFGDLIKKSKGLFVYKLAILREKFPESDSEAMAEIAKEMLVTISKVRNAVIKAGYIKELAQELGVKEEAIWDELKKTKRNVKAPGSMLQAQGVVRKIDIPPAEKILVKLMIEDAGVVNTVKDNLQPFDFKNPDIRHLVETLFGMDTKDSFIDAGKLINYLEGRVAPHVISFIVNEDIMIKDKERNVSDCIKVIKKNQRDSRLKDIQNRLVVAQKNGYEDEARGLLEEFNKLIKGGV